MWDINGDGNHDAIDDALFLAMMDETENEEKIPASPSKKSKTQGFGCAWIITGVILVWILIHS